MNIIHQFIKLVKLILFKNEQNQGTTEGEATPQETNPDETQI